MGPDRLDKFIKKQVEDHKTPTDPDLLWQKILEKQNVEEKPKRRFLIFWLLGGALLLSSVALFYTLQNSNAETTLGGNENPIENPTLNNATKETNTNQTELTITDLTKTNTAVQSTDLSERSTLSSGLTAIENKKPNESALKNLNTNNPNASDLNNTKASNGNDNFAETSASASAHANDSNDSELTSVVANNTTTIDGNNIPPTATNSTEQEEAVNEKAVNNKDTQDNSSTHSVAFAKSELLTITKLSILLDEQKIAQQFVAEQEEKEDFPPYKYNKRLAPDKETPWSLSNGLAYTYGKAPRTLSEGNSTPAGYLNTRNDMETSLDAVRINLDFMAQHKSGLYLKSGIEYEQINERFLYYTEWDSTVINPNQIVALVYAMDGSVLEREGGRKDLTTFWYQAKRYNRYHSIDIPILVGYNSRKEDKKFGWFVEGGVSTNIWFKASGEIHDTEGAPIRLEDNPDLFKTRTGLSLIAGAGATYQFADKFSIWASPGLKYHLSSITSKENTLDQKYLNIGLQAGIRYHWNN